MLERLTPNLVLGIALAFCSSCSDDAPATVGAGIDDATVDMADAALSDVPDGSIADSGNADAAPDSSPDQGGAPIIPPFVPGPDPSLFDCTSSAPTPARVSPIALSCVLDSTCRDRMVVGHRSVGGQFATIAPENSLEGIKAAILMGLDGVELDVRHTSDDRLVLMHDASVDRTTDGTGAVASMTLAEVQALALNAPSHRLAVGDFSCARPPSIEDVFALTKGRVFVDLDTKTDRVELVVSAIMAAGVEDEVFVSVSSIERAVEARTLAPSIRVQIRPDTVDEYASQKALFSRPPEVVEIPYSLMSTLGESIRSDGSMPFTNVFNLDAPAYLSGDGQAYLDVYEAGGGILQSEYPSLVLDALGR